MSAAHPQMQAILDRAAASPGPPLRRLTPEAARKLDAETFDAYWNADAPALQVSDGRGHGAVTDLRWHGKAGLARPTKSQWKLKPGRA